MALDSIPIDELCVHTIRTLSMDAVQKANSGHPGAPMALAPVAYALWTGPMRFNPKNPDWFGRDRFVLSNGHASMLQYALLHLCGYDMPLSELQRFRQWESTTPGHPESFQTAGVETTTGPLGQGLLNSVGMAMAEAWLAARYNRPGHDIIDHRTWVICGDGDLMEGASHEAASLAGHLGLGKLTWIYDDNHITIDGDTALAFSEDVPTRFAGYGWHVIDVGDKANDLAALQQAYADARAEADRPTLICVRTRIGFGAPNKENTAAAHGAPLGPDEIRGAKRSYGWPEDEDFLVPDRVAEHMGRCVDRGADLEATWSARVGAWREAFPELAAEFDDAVAGRLTADWDDQIPAFQPSDGPIATRAASGKVLNAFAAKVPNLVGGSADLSGSNNSLIADSGSFSREDRGGRNMRWGVREHAMCGAAVGMALHGGVRPYTATFLVFTDYCRPSIRLAAMMKLPVVYIMTHDSIGLGEDGPTHQPIEHLAAMRAIPGLRVMRPADACEVAAAWRVAIERDDAPTLLSLTRQKLPILEETAARAAQGVRRGAYVLSPEDGDRPDLILIATGSEVAITLRAKALLARDGIRARVVSMPSWSLFSEQPRSYRDEVLPPSVKARLAVEAGATFGWHRWVGDHGEVIGIDRFGASAPAPVLFERFGFTDQAIAERGRALLGTKA